MNRLWIPLLALLVSACSPNSDTGRDTVPAEALSFTLNDTGVVRYAVCDPAFKDTIYPTGTPQPSLFSDSAPSGCGAQDASNGRDTTEGVGSDGRVGFAFTKLDSNGEPLADQTLDYATLPWSCVRDEVTGRVWEVKTDSGFHKNLSLYSWYNPDSASNGGHAGDASGGLQRCPAELSACTTQALIEATNAEQLCGYSDWRLPTVMELMSLLDYSVAGDASTPMIDTGYFPNTYAHDHWTSQTAVYAGSDGSQAWEVHFDNGYAEGHSKSATLALRLVRGR